MKQLNLTVLLEGILPFSDFLKERGALSVSAFEDKKDTNFYTIQATFSEEDPQLGDVLKGIAKKISIPHPTLEWFQLDANRNWIKEVQENFPSLQIGRFFIHGSHVSKQDVEGAKGVPVQVDAATAFGTGEHETTQGCLHLLAFLHEKGTFLTQALDMGCGTGILAIAAAKLWPSLPVHCIDIDAQAVEQAEKNSEKNQVFTKMTFQQGDTPTPSSNGRKFDLVMANILANPLKEMAPDMEKATNSTAKLILSGLLTKQKEGILETYKACGFKLEKSVELNEWTSLLLETV
ncbi:MAG: methyltransferase domain-containing protein [bacterium]|nr:methyltransferase domain-containing protein [bacterium]